MSDKLRKDKHWKEAEHPAKVVGSIAQPLSMVDLESTARTTLIDVVPGVKATR